MFAQTSANPNRKIWAEKLERLHEEIDTFFFKNLQNLSYIVDGS
jgi:hypothetical protein